MPRTVVSALKNDNICQEVANGGGSLKNKKNKAKKTCILVKDNEKYI